MNDISHLRMHKQKFRHLPDEGVFGDCYRTCIACLLMLDPEDVPHEHRQMGAEEFVAFYRGWLHDHGIHRLVIPLATQSVEEALRTAEIFSDGVPYIFLGTSRTGVNHAVIGHDGAIVHDPSLTDAGIIGPCDDGYFWVEWLVSPAWSQAARPSAGPAGGQPPAGGEQAVRQS